MILLIEAGGIRSSPSLSNRTVLVSASMISARFARVSNPGPPATGGADVPDLPLGSTSWPFGAVPARSFAPAAMADRSATPGRARSAEIKTATATGLALHRSIEPLPPYLLRHHPRVGQARTDEPGGQAIRLLYRRNGTDPDAVKG